MIQTCDLEFLIAILSFNHNDFLLKSYANHFVLNALITLNSEKK